MWATLTPTLSGLFPQPFVVFNLFSFTHGSMFAMTSSSSSLSVDSVSSESYENVSSVA